MNTYETSDGIRVKKSTIDRKVRQAKAEKLALQYHDKGYNFCEKTGISNGQYLDCSHIISVDQCQKTGRTELAWDLDNIEILCRSEHVRIEMMTNREREEYYQSKVNI